MRVCVNECARPGCPPPRRPCRRGKGGLTRWGRNAVGTTGLWTPLPSGHMRTSAVYAHISLTQDRNMFMLDMARRTPFSEGLLRQVMLLPVLPRQRCRLSEAVLNGRGEAHADMEARKIWKKGSNPPATKTSIPVPCEGPPSTLPTAVVSGVCTVNALPQSEDRLC